jgi:hypothetical protein
VTEPREVRLELMLGSRVRDPSGRVVGRLEEIRTVPSEGELVVREYLIGAAGAIERLAAWRIVGAVLGIPRRLGGRGYRIPWKDMDLSDPHAPRLRRPIGEFARGPDAKRIA